MDNPSRARYHDLARRIESARFEMVDFRRFDEKSDIWNFIPHSHDFYELLFFLHGNAQISLSDRSLYATYADALIYPPGVTHTEHLQINHRQEIYCLQARCPDIALEEVVQVQDWHQQLKLQLDGLFAEFGGEGEADVMRGYLRQLALLVARSALLGNAPSHPVDYCMMYMRHNLAKDIHIGQLAELIHVSRSCLNNMFVKHAGISPIQYLTDIRMEAAKSMLMTSGRRIGEISEAVGYNSPKYFCRAFERCTGLSPRDFRKAERLQAFVKSDNSFGR